MTRHKILTKAYITAVLVCTLAGFVLNACAAEPAFPLAEVGPYTVGMSTAIDFVDTSREDREISINVWYPAILPQGAQPTEDNFNAPPDLGGAPYPLILSSSTVAYIFGKHLASYGFVVMGVNRMNPYDPWDTHMIDYPLDILFVLNQVASTAPEGLEGMINADQTGVMGYSFDGYNSLAMSGARIDPTSYRQRCEEMLSGEAIEPDWWPEYACAPAQDWDAFSAHAGAALTSSDDGLWQPMTDERIRAVMPMAPEGMELFGEAGLAAVDRPVLIIGATLDEDSPYWLQAVPIFESIQTTDKGLISFVGQEHMMIYDEEPVRRMSHFAVAFFGYHLQGRSEYTEYYNETFVKQFNDLAWGVYAEK